MRQLQTIAGRLVVANLSIVAGACILLGTLAVVNRGNVTALGLRQQMEMEYQAVITSFDGQARTAATLSAAMSKIPAIEDAILHEDQAALAALLGDAFDAVKAQGIDTWTITKPPGVAFYRPHNPRLFDDDVTVRRRMVVKAYRPESR